MSTAPLDERLKSLTPEQRALLERRLLERREGASPYEPIAMRAGPGPWPLSYSQELLWLLDQLAPSESAYNSPDAVRLQGPLDVEALQEALTSLVERHEILRTTYEFAGDRPVQTVRPPAAVAPTLHDLSGLAEQEREVELRRLFKQEAEAPFDLASGPVLRASLARLAPDEHAFLVNVHHIATDGWSKAVVWRELGELYNANVGGRPPELRELPIQYADFAVWQRDWLDSGVVDPQLTRWKERLWGAPDLLELPTDRPRPRVQSYRGDHLYRLYDPALLEGLSALGRSEESTLFMTLLAGFAALLGRYCGQDDVVVGTPIAGRSRVELEEMVGYFMNTLALRIDLSGSPTFRELVRRARQTSMDAFADQEVPYEKVVTELNPGRDLSRTPLFQVMMVLQNQVRTALELADLVVTPFILDRAWSKFDITLGMGERPQGLNTNWEYSTELFDASTIERMMGHFGRLVEAAVSEPDRPVSALPLLTEDERRILVDWNATDAPKVEATLDGFIEAQARRTPTAVAVECEGELVTYEELDGYANRIASVLVRLGVGSGEPVAICLERSPDLVAGLLGTLKAGGACLPLDPAYPQERLAFMLSDSGARILITQNAFMDQLPDGAAHVLLVDDEADALGAEGDTPPEVSADPDRAAYVIYTSGSTGQPRGVVLPHRGLVNHALASVDLYGLTPADRVLQFSSISFDISIEEIFPTLASGGTIVFRTDDTPLAGTPFVEWIASRHITVLDLPTAFWHAWVNDLSGLGLQAPECLRLLIVGGEKASARAYGRWLGVGGDRVAFFNTYGPTEASVIATAAELLPSESEPDELPIGSPIANVKLYVLDGNGEPVPIGVPGELYIGGQGVATGYHGLPELTAERFVASPFGDGPSDRLYRTGDVVRWLADGNLAFVGRFDDQVKIRGFRVEPREVEAALEAHPAVGAAVVVVHEPRPDDKVLAAYVEGVWTDVAPGPAELREFLSQRLPAYMVPSSITILDRFPLTPNDKVDREALPAPDLGDLWERQIVEPRDEVEAGLEAIWCRVLGLEGPLSIHDDFFALGGHSLLAVHLVSEIERELGVRLPLNSLFDGATIEQLAAAFRVEQRSNDAWSPLVPLRTGGTKTPLFLLHGMQGELLIYRGLVPHLDPERPVYGLQPRGLDGRENPHMSLEEMAAEYVRTLRGQQPEGPYLLAGYCFSGVIAYEVARQLEGAGDRVALLAVVDASPIGLERPTRLQLERRKFAEFRSLDRSGKAAWVTRRARGLWMKIRKRVWWAIYDVFALIGRPPPRRLQNIAVANARARQTYVTQVSSCRLTLFRAKTGDDDTFPAAWGRLAGGGVDVHPIASNGIQHDNIMKEPHVQVLAAELTHCIEAALAAEDVDASLSAMA